MLPSTWRGPGVPQDSSWRPRVPVGQCQGQAEVMAGEPQVSRAHQEAQGQAAVFLGGERQGWTPSGRPPKETNGLPGKPSQGGQKLLACSSLCKTEARPPAPSPIPSSSFPYWLALSPLGS